MDGEEEGKGEGRSKGKGMVEERLLKKSWMHGRMHGHSGDFILCPTLCIALDRQEAAVSNEHKSKPNKVRVQQQISAKHGIQWRI